MKKRFFSILLICLLSQNSSATSLSSDELRNSLNEGQFSQTLATLSADTADHDEFWYWLNLARLQQINGDFSDSIASFEKAYAILDEYENRAKVSLRNVGSFIGSALLSKGAETYYGKGYERTLMHTLNALNYVMIGNLEGASVEMRRMEQRQEFWLKETEEKIKEASEEQEKAAKSGTNTSSMPSGYSMASMLENEEVRNLANSYQDPFSYALSSIITTTAFKSPEQGEVSLKRALALNPNASHAFFKSKEPIKASVQATPPSPSTPQKAVKGKKPSKTPVAAPSVPQIIAPQKMKVTLIILSGEAPAVKIEKIRFPIFNGADYTSIDLPAFNPPQNDISVVTLSTSHMQMQPPRLLQTNLMAYKTLKDEFFGDLSKAVVRATTKAIAAKQASDHFGFFGGLVASLAMDAGSSYADSGYRNWEMLPNSGYLANFEATKGDNLIITMNNQQTKVALPNDKEEMFILISYVTPDNIRINHVTY